MIIQLKCKCGARIKTKRLYGYPKDVIYKWWELHQSCVAQPATFRRQAIPSPTLNANTNPR